MKKIVISLVIYILSSGIVYAGTLLNYPYVYKGVRSLGMGGAFTAVGKDAEALFYNPAGLYDMGFQLSVFNPLIEVNTDTINLAKEIDDLNKISDPDEQEAATFDLLKDKAGDIGHFRFSLFPHFAVKNFALGAVGNSSFDMRLHDIGNSQGPLELNGGYVYGPITGFSMGVPGTDLRFGVGFKFLYNRWLQENFTFSDIFDFMDDPKTIEDKTEDLEEEKTDFSLDAGVLYDLPYAESLKPKIGFSILDITDLDFQKDGTGLRIPMRANIGASINPSLVGFMDTIIAVDYQDITYAYDQDSSFGKRLHVGGELGFLSRHILLRAGLNQGYPALGAELDLWLLRVAYAQYSEEMGAYAGQDKDTRQLVQINIGW